MLKTLTSFEVRYHMRQVSFWVVAAIMFLLGLALTVFFNELGGAGGERIKINGAGFVTSMVGSWDSLAVFFAAVFTAGGLLRDDTFKAVEVVHSTPVSTTDMVLSRMIGVYIAVFLLISAGTLGTFLGQFAPNVPDEVLGPVRPHYYLVPMLMLTAVNAAVLVAFFTLVAGLSRSRMITLVSSVALLAITALPGFLINTDLPEWLKSIADPLGNIAYGIETEFWSDTDRNERVIPLLGFVGLNRLVWGGIALAVLTASFFLFKRGLETGARKSRVDTTPPPTHAYAPVTPRTGLGANMAAALSQARLDTAYITRSIPFYILIGVFALLYILVVVLSIFIGPQKQIPTSETMAMIGTGSSFLPMILAVSFFSGEIMWRDKTHKVTELAHSTRVANWPLVLGKWAAMFALVAIFALLPAVLGVIVQALIPSPPVDVAAHLGFALFTLLPRYLGITVLALFMQSFAPNRIVGMMLAFGACAFVLFGLNALPFNHPLMDIFGTSPGGLSEMAGYSGWISFRWFNLYAIGAAIVLGTFAVWLSRRGVQGGVLHRLRSVPSRLNAPIGAALAIGLAITVGTGAVIQRSLDAVDFRTRSENEERQVAWEELFGDHLEEPTPSVTDVTFLADLYPSKREATISGTFQITNLTDTPITDSFLSMATSHEEDVRRFEVDGGELLKDGTAFGDLPVEEIRDYNVEVVRFDPPLAPGDTREVRFATYFHPPRLNDGSVIRANGTFLNQNQSTPTFGLNDRRMRNPDKRRKYGLDELERMAERDDEEARRLNLFGVSTRIMLDGTVCTDADQIGIAPGRLVEQTQDDGRDCRRYVTNTPIVDFYSIVSGRYDVTEGLWTSADGREVPVQVFHHPEHTYSVDAMIEATKHGLTVYEREFTPYRLDYFRILEIPYIGFAQAFAGTIPFSESGFILDTGDPEDPASVDNASAVTLHELAHQWFGHELTPARVKGFNVLSEGLTSYATTLAYEELYGFEKARTMMELNIGTLAAKKMFDKEKEVPVAVAEMQGYLHYEKPDWILWGLRGYVGKDPVNAALRDVLAEYGDGRMPFATTQDIVDAFKANIDENYHTLIEDQWEHVTTWKLEFRDGYSVEPTEDGRYRVRVPVTVDKLRLYGEDDKETSVSEIPLAALEEWVEVGFYAEPPKEGWGDWQALETAFVTEEESVLEFILDEKPNHVALDPRRLLQERQVLDNVRDVSGVDAADSEAS